MTDSPLQPDSQIEAPATDDDLPMTVPIAGMARPSRVREPHSFDRRADQQEDKPTLHTPAIRIARRPMPEIHSPELSTPVSSLIDLDQDTVEDLIPPGMRPMLRVVRGRKVNLEYPIKDGTNYIGRRDDTPIEIDLEDQEHSERIWTSRKHAVLHFADGMLEIEDLNSLNGTFVNRIRVLPGERRLLKLNDIVQVGTIQMRVVAGQ